MFYGYPREFDPDHDHGSHPPQGQGPVALSVLQPAQPQQQYTDISGLTYIIEELRMRETGLLRKIEAVQAFGIGAISVDQVNAAVALTTLV